MSDRTGAAPATPAKLWAKQNTKVEHLAEAIETIVAGTAAEILGKASPNGPADMTKKFLADARVQLRETLQAFLVPALHLVDNGPRQPYMPNVPREDRVECAACHRHFICADVKCPHWHEAIKASINKPIPSEGVEDDGDTAA